MRRHICQTSCCWRLSTICLLLNHSVRTWVFESLVHSNLGRPWSFLLGAHVGSLKVLVHRASSGFELLISISLILIDFTSIFSPAKVSLFAWVGSTSWRFIHSCPDSILWNLIVSDILATNVIQLIDFVWPTYRIVGRSLQKLRFWWNNCQIIDWTCVPLIDMHIRSIDSVLSYCSTVETTTSTVAIFSLLVALHSFDTQ